MRCLETVRLMPRNARKPLTALLIALHALIVVCGQAMHASPGLSHASAPAGSREGDGLPRWADLSVAPTEHCPVCEYFAQGQLPLVAGLPILARPVSPLEPVLLPAHSPLRLVLASRSRAPPRGDAQVS